MSEFSQQILKTIGNYLARGLSSQEIIEALIATEIVDSVEKASELVKGFYENWTHTNTLLDLNTSDLYNWHIFLRHTLLQKSMSDESPQGVRVALAILDSMAEIQGVTQNTDELIAKPIQIELIPVSSNNEKIDIRDDDDKHDDTT